MYLFTVEANCWDGVSVLAIFETVENCRFPTAIESNHDTVITRTSTKINQTLEWLLSDASPHCNVSIRNLSHTRNLSQVHKILSVNFHSINSLNYYKFSSIRDIWQLIDDLSRSPESHMSREHVYTSRQSCWLSRTDAGWGRPVRNDLRTGRYGGALRIWAGTRAEP